VAQAWRKSYHGSGGSIGVKRGGSIEISARHGMAYLAAYQRKQQIMAIT